MKLSQVFENCRNFNNALEFDIGNAIDDHSVAVWDKVQRRTTYTTRPQPHDIILIDCRRDNTDEYSIYTPDINDVSGYVMLAVYTIEEHDPEGLASVINA